MKSWNERHDDYDVELECSLGGVLSSAGAKL